MSSQVAKTTVSTVPHKVIRENRDDGTILLSCGYDTDPVVNSTIDWLRAWAEKTPDNILIAERSGDSWREVSYAQALQMVERLAHGLLNMDIDHDKPLLVLSGNGVDHGLLALATQMIGMVLVPLAEQYSLIPEAQGRMDYIAGRVAPGAVYVADTGPYGSALDRESLANVGVITSNNSANRDGVALIDDLLQSADNPSFAARSANVGPDTLAKILFTSGSTSQPKGVRTTQKMMCVNQAQLAPVLPFLKEKPPRIVDWLPWNHVFGGSHNFNMMLANGGSIYIDNGKPLKALFDNTLSNLKDYSATISFNVPVAFAMLAEAMKEDEALRKKYFQELDMIFYAGASLPQPVWQALEEGAIDVTGELPLMTTSWGLTETAPATLIQHEPIRRSGVIGVPMPGVVAKLIPDDQMRCEIRVKGPNIMEGYYNDPEKTAESFDEEGFFITGDAVRFVDVDDANKGLIFDGRVSEDFKLLTGTWVQASTLRMKVLDVFKSLAQDLVICGQDRNEIGIMIFPNEACRGMGDADGEIIVSDALREKIGQMLKDMAENSTGSATRVTRALIVSKPASMETQEITAKGNLNVRQVQNTRKNLVERLYDDQDSATILLEK